MMTLPSKSRAVIEVNRTYRTRTLAFCPSTPGTSVISYLIHWWYELERVPYSCPSFVMRSVAKKKKQCFFFFSSRLERATIKELSREAQTLHPWKGTWTSACFCLWSLWIRERRLRPRCIIWLPWKGELLYRRRKGCGLYHVRRRLSSAWVTTSRLGSGLWAVGSGHVDSDDLMMIIWWSPDHQNPHGVGMIKTHAVDVKT